VTQVNLYAASTQWMLRPADQRFWTLDEMLRNAEAEKNTSTEAAIKVCNLIFKGIEGETNGLTVVSKLTGQEAFISNLAFGQMAARLNYPVTGLIDKVDAELAAQILNHRRDKIVAGDPDAEVMALLNINDVSDRIMIRAVTSERYTRVWDTDVIPYAMKLQEKGWKVPPARPSPNYNGEVRIATEQDILAFGEGGVQVRVGDEIGPAGLYRGDRDMFIIMVNDKNRVDDGAGHSLMEGMIIRNSEVGCAAVSATRFKMQGVCGNHIIWNVQDILSVKYRHTGEAGERTAVAFDKLINDYQPLSFERDLQVMDWMRRNVIAAGEDEVVKAIYRFRIPVMTQKILSAAYKNAEQFRDVDGDPNTWMGFVNALTRYSQTLTNADERHKLDEGAGKLMEIAAKVCFGAEQ
jgi:hypothetical protein